MNKNNIKILCLVVALLMITVTAYAAPSKALKVTYDPRVEDTYGDSVSPAAIRVADLMAGQNITVGGLYISPTTTPGQFEVRYEIDDSMGDWFFSEIHFEGINSGDENYIYSKGGLIPGKFTVNEKFDQPTINVTSGAILGGTQEFSFLYTSTAMVTSFAAHAVVCEAVVTTDTAIVQDGTFTVSDSAISTEGMSTSGGPLSVFVREPFDYTVPEFFSVWDQAFASNSADFVAQILANGADFIWNDYFSSGATTTPTSVASSTTNDLTIYGDVFRVDVPVDIPLEATSIGAVLFIVADNGYIAKTDHTIINHAGFDSEAYKSLANDPADDLLTGDALLLYQYDTVEPRNTSGEALFVEAVVDGDAWTSMIAVGTPFDLDTGLNTINIMAVNEAIIAGVDGDTADGNDYTNPAGVIFFIEYSYEMPNMVEIIEYSLEFSCESAWGSGIPVNEEDEGGNWSMVIANRFTD